MNRWSRSPAVELRVFWVGVLSILFIVLLSASEFMVGWQTEDVTVSTIYAARSCGRGPSARNYVDDLAVVPDLEHLRCIIVMTDHGSFAVPETDLSNWPFASRAELATSFNAGCFVRVRLSGWGNDLAHGNLMTFERNKVVRQASRLADC